MNIIGRNLSLVLLFFFYLSSAQKPNILYISIDDLNNWVGYLEGHPKAQTPNIDRLAKQGIAFTNAHCTTPLCHPSRTAILTGLKAENNGVYNNGDKFDYRDFKMLPQYFSDNNYTTYGTGKIHHKRINSKIFQHAFDTQQRWSPFEASKDVEYTPEELSSKGTDKPRHLVKNGPGGKDYILPFNGMSSERSPNDPKGESFDWNSFDLPDEAFGDGKITSWAIEQLQNHDSEKPFFMGVGYYRPHIPLYVPKKYFDLYPLESVQLPDVLAEDLADIPKAGKERALGAVTAGTHRHVTTHNQWPQAVQAYLACVSFVDSQIGRLLDFLNGSPYANNTIIVLFSDHGWHLGEKEAWGKFSPWVHSTNVPFIIAPTNNTNGQLCDEPVSLLDIYPTLADLADLPQPQVDGQSLVSLLHNPDMETDRVVKTQVDMGNYALSSKEWRYVRYKDGGEELYDIKKDPLEFNNLLGVDGKNREDYQGMIDDLHKRILQDR